MACSKCHKSSCNGRCGCNKNVVNTIPVPCQDLLKCPITRDCDYIIDFNCVVKTESGYIIPSTTNPGLNWIVQQNTSLDGFIQQYLIFSNPATQACALTGWQSKIVPHFRVWKQSGAIIVSFLPVNNNELQSGFTVTNYTIEITDLQTNTTYSYTVPATGPYQQIITPTGTMSFTSGNSFAITVTTNTSDGTNNAQCTTIQSYISF